MRWVESNRADPVAREIADRHYNRQKIGSPQFRKVEPILIHAGIPTFGLTWVKAGFRYVGKTKAGLLAYQMLPKDMPAPEAALPRSELQLERAAA